ncbi:MAG: flavodoxin family protein [Candidatus Electrothrix sp. GM3_4]|nr:flavodoxin family protein [Candidatus Electrothrix sp. GM3_4]
MDEQFSKRKIVILDGTRSCDKHLDPILALLTDVVHKYHSDRTQIFKLQDIKLNPCIGCFNCWVSTPGKCIHGDAGPDILQAIVNSNTVIFFTPVVFGGYSSELKKIVDRFLPTVLPFFEELHGETNHRARYLSSPRFIGVGVQSHPQKREAKCFKMLVGRNAINCNVSKYAAEVVASTDSPETLYSQFQALLSRSDRLPWRSEASSLLKEKNFLPKSSTGKHRALLIVGSQKIKHPSTSSFLGEYLLKRLKKHDWKTESLTLGRDLLDERGQDNLCSSVDEADTILLFFPLYVDTLPFLVTKALEVMALRRNTADVVRPKRLFALINSGFPEPYQSAVALAVCRNFALECDMIWAGGLVMGCGEGLLSGQSAAGFKGLRGLKRPPLYYINRALKLSADALAEGHPVPEKAKRLIAKKPIPLITFSLWRQIFIKLGKSIWVKEATLNGVTKEKLFDRPYATETTSSLSEKKSGAVSTDSYGNSEEKEDD